MKALLFYFVLASSIILCTATDVKFKEFGFVMSHDAASGMLDPSIGAVKKYAQTQLGNLTDQLNCGARVLDLRVMLVNGTLEFHHGRVIIDYGVQNGMNDVSNWLQDHPQELVVLNWVCPGALCWAALEDQLLSYNLPALNEDCDALNDLTIDEIHDMASVEQGGYILSLKRCPEENYESSIECWGVELSGNDTLEVYSCSEESNTDIPYAQFWDYIYSTIAEHSDGLWMIQAHWQTSIEAAILGELHGSTLLDDEEKSGMNNLFTEAIRQGYVSASDLNFVELDYVCDGGLDLFQVLDASNQEKVLRAHRMQEGSSPVVTKNKQAQVS